MPIILNGNGPVSGVTSITGAGLDLITTQTFSAASSISVNNCFSPTYQNYRFVYDITANSGGAVELYVRLRASGVDRTTTYLGGRFYGLGTSAVSAIDSTTAWHVGFTNSTDAARSAGAFEIYRPNLAAVKVYHGQSTGWASNVLVDQYGGFCTTASAHDGLTMYPDTGTITGTFRVYGYRNS